MIVTLDAKRRLKILAEPGDCFDASSDAREDTPALRWLAVMWECPVSPDDVPPRRREPARRRKL